MKNSLKTGFLAIAISVCVSACEPPKAGSDKSPVDSGKSVVDTSQKLVDTARKTATDTIKKDTVKKK